MAGWARRESCRCRHRDRHDSTLIIPFHAGKHRLDWQIIGSEFAAYARALPDRVISHLKLLEGDFGDFPIDRYSHSLQTATRALRAGLSQVDYAG